MFCNKYHFLVNTNRKFNYILRNLYLFYYLYEKREKRKEGKRERKRNKKKEKFYVHIYIFPLHKDFQIVNDLVILWRKKKKNWSRVMTDSWDLRWVCKDPSR